MVRVGGRSDVRGMSREMKTEEKRGLEVGMGAGNREEKERSI